MGTLTKMSARDLLLDGRAVTGSAGKNSRLVNLRDLGIYPGVAGGSQGYNTSGDVLTATADGVDLNELWNEFQASLNFYNERRQALLDLVTFNVTTPIDRVPVPGGDDYDFERASEFGEPVGIRTRVAYQSLGYDFEWFDLAIRFTWMFLAESGAGQVESLNGAAMSADTRLLFRKVMEAIFRNVTRQASNPPGQDQSQLEALTVFPFYNGDGWIPPRFKNNEFDGTHTHYLTTQSQAVESEDLDAMIEHLRHHGYGDTPGAAQILVLANDQDIAPMRAFRVSEGDSYDFIQPQQVTWPRFIADGSEVAGGTPPSEVAGIEVAGQYGPALVLSESWIPPGYLFATATGGSVTAENPVGIREHQNASLRGLRLVKGREPDYPLVDSFYQRGFGTGVRHRGNGVVMQITESGSYSIPTEYQNVA